MASTFDYIAVGVAALVALPAAIYMAPLIVIGLAVGVLVTAYAGREAFDVFKVRQYGASADDPGGQSLDQLRSNSSDSSPFNREGK